MWCTVEIEHHCRNFDDMWESAKETHLLCCSSTQNFPFNDFNICFFSTAATQSVTGCYQVCSLLQNKESSSCLILMLDNLVLSIIKKATLKPPQMAAVCRQRDEINNAGNATVETYACMKPFENVWCTKHDLETGQN